MRAPVQPCGGDVTSYDATPSLAQDLNNLQINFSSVLASQPARLTAFTNCAECDDVTNSQMLRDYCQVVTEENARYQDLKLREESLDARPR